MPGLTSDSFDWNDPASWQAGFSPSNNQLVCDVCRCLVRKSPGDTKAHLAWHEKLGS